MGRWFDQREGQLDDQLQESKSSRRLLCDLSPLVDVLCLCVTCCPGFLCTPICSPNTNTTVDRPCFTPKPNQTGEKVDLLPALQNQSHHENLRPANAGCDMPKGHPCHTLSALSCQVLPPADAATPSHTCPTHASESVPSPFLCLKLGDLEVSFNPNRIQPWVYKQRCVTFPTLGVGLG